MCCGGQFQTFSRSICPNSVTTLSRAYSLQSSVNILHRAVRNICKEVCLYGQRYRIFFACILILKRLIYCSAYLYWSYLPSCMWETCMRELGVRIVCAGGLYAQVYVMNAWLFCLHSFAFLSCVKSCVSGSNCMYSWVPDWLHLIVWSVLREDVLQMAFACWLNYTPV